MALGVERRADRADHPVQHPARRHDVHARIGVRDGDPAEDGERLVVQHVAVRVEQAAMAVARVLAEADVGDHDEVGARGLERPGGLLDDAVLCVALGAELVLLGRDPEEQHGPDAELVELRGLGGERVDGELCDPRHRRDRLAHALAGSDEERVDEVARIQRRLADEVAERARPAPAARAPRARPRVHALDRVRLDVIRHARSPKCDVRA